MVRHRRPEAEEQLGWRAIGGAIRKRRPGKPPSAGSPSPPAGTPRWRLTDREKRRRRCGGEAEAWDAALPVRRRHSPLFLCRPDELREGDDKQRVEEIENGGSKGDVREDANAHCPGTQLEEAGKADSCAGCPNQQICATAPRAPILIN